VIETPGHTAGHCSVHLPDRGVLLTGDAMVNFDYATGKTDLSLHRFNEDREQARASLKRFEGLEAETMLFGHGDPWTGGLEQALDQSRASDETSRT
jgi:glyoxylase-like metal-dependent hydrolase (beta-lactamase superfamily II)